MEKDWRDMWGKCQWDKKQQTHVRPERHYGPLT